MSLDNLKKQRKSIKSKLTRVKTFLDTQADAATIDELKFKIKLLESAWSEFQENHNKILEVIPDDEMDAEEADFVIYETTYSNTSVGIMALITTKTVTFPSVLNTPATPESSGSSEIPHSVFTVPPMKADVKLPRMDLPTFSGNNLEWESFRDLFTSIIHNNDKISNSQKLHYLKNAVQSDAQLLLRSIDVTDANYYVAWDLLKDRYDNQRQLALSHLKALFSQSSMVGECSSQLRKLVDSTTQHVRALKNLGFPTDNWDAIIVFLVTDKLDSESRREWELASPGKSLPPLQDLTAFLDQRCRALEATGKSKPNQITLNNQSGTRHASKTHISTESKSSCPICKSYGHLIYKCTDFLKLDPKARSDAVKRSRLCFNCLRPNHSVSECKSESTCRTCKSKHNTLLHVNRPMQQQLTSLPRNETQESINLSNHSSNQDGIQVLLKTALVSIMDKFGTLQTCRAFLDDGSQSCLITDACVRRLQLSKSTTDMRIHGVGNSSLNPCGKINLVVHSKTSPFSIPIHATVLKSLTGHLPQSRINISNWTYLRNLTLADTGFNEPGPVDLLLGADVYEDIVSEGRIVGQDGMPTIRNTHLGWVISGKVSGQGNSSMVHISTIDVSNQLRKFWELENLTQTPRLTNDEKECEALFETTSRDSTGRYVVSIPFKQNNQQLGLSREICMKRLYSVEKRLHKFPQYKMQYDKFMDEYLQLGHMEQVPVSQQHETPSVTNYLPHHFVLKEGSTTTSLRVVFDASAKTTSGVSLNERMLIGPKLQDDLHQILLRFRLPKYVFTADIEKMYRQIRATPEDSNLQRILWRTSPSCPVQEFRLTTVTYGTASAPYLAVKTLQQLADDDGHEFPIAKQIIKSDFYVDDVMFGKDKLEDVLQAQTELISILKQGGFHLRKWSANHASLLASVPPEDRETQLPLSINADQSIKTLGLHWSPSNDHLFFKVNLSKSQNIITKRTILSETARLFDPLGWLSPVIIKAKVIFQKLWLIGVEWDDGLPKEIQDEWISYRNQLTRLENLKIPRHIGSGFGSAYQLHGFSDASEKAYSAVVYLRSTNTHIISTHLLTSKTKVAPVKQVSLPRLELCGAALLARLMDKVKRTLHLNIDSLTAWTDSSDTLAWISKHSSKWTTFVGNRVGEIQSLMEPSCWRYVPSAQNPADCASRGVMPEELIQFQLWWNGPIWLSEKEESWPANLQIRRDITLEQRKKIVMLMTKDTLEWPLICRFSSLNTLKRVTAWCIRAIANLRCPKPMRITKEFPLTTYELKHALLALIKYVQLREFPEAFQRLIKEMPPPNQLASLSPFIDEDGLLRVGGRLRNSHLPPDQKFPILLPKSHSLTRLIIEHEHIAQLHAGPQLLLATLQQSYWIVNVRSLVRNVIHKCVRCSRFRAALTQQQMADLPSHRVQPCRPFLKTGVDFGGPYQIVSSRGRGSKTTKCYMSLFVCMSTKATHLESVSDLSSDAFIAAFRRFVSRRGKPSHMFSDNGTNFTGADNELKKLSEFVSSHEFNEDLSRNLADIGTLWHFIPANAPHFGGLWEAGIKSTKKHLIRVIGEQKLTFEEFYTVLTQIEACLNSRPLCQLTTDPSDLSALTPGHFLIGEPLNATPDPDVTHLTTNRLSRWQLVQSITQHFWRR